MRTETLQRLANIERTCADIDARWDLYGPLLRKLLPMTFAIAKRGWPLGGWTIHLCIEDFPRQYMAGVARCLGVDITWFTRIWRCPMEAHKHDLDLRILGIEWRRA